MLDMPFERSGQILASDHRFADYHQVNGTTKTGSLPTIRLAVSSDKQKVINVINKVAGERRFLQTCCYQPTPAWELLLDVGIHDGGILLVVELEQEIIGFGRLTAITPASSNATQGNIGLALLPAYRSQGMGSAILAHLLDWANKQSIIKIDAAILADNQHSRSLFAKFGFATLCYRDVKLSFRKNSVEEVLVELDMAKEGLLCSD